MQDGYTSFIISILLIGVLTALIGDLAAHLGYTCNLKDTVTAIAFVALGTSIPGRIKSSKWNAVAECGWTGHNCN